MFIQRHVILRVNNTLEVNTGYIFQLQMNELILLVSDYLCAIVTPHKVWTVFLLT